MLFSRIPKLFCKLKGIFQAREDKADTKTVTLIGKACPVYYDSLTAAVGFFLGHDIPVSVNPVKPVTDGFVILTSTPYDASSDGVIFMGDETTELGRELIGRFAGHPHLRVIGNHYPDEAKADRLILELSAVFGVPKPLEIERKFLIDKPDTEVLEKLPFCRKASISQTYLTFPDGSRARVRRRVSGNEELYFHTVKKQVTPLIRTEVERIISRDEYLAYLNDPSTAKASIEKDRYCIVHDSQYFELDVFPFWDDKALLEIELCSEDDDVRFPDFVKIIKEVSSDKAYNNSTLAETNPMKEGIKFETH